MKVGDSELVSLDPGWLRYMRSEKKLKGRKVEMIVDGDQIIIRAPKETDISVST